MRRVIDLVGKPFKEGGKGPAGYDCWGLALEVFRRYGILVPDYRLTCGTITSGVLSKSDQWVRCVGEVTAPALIVFTTTGIADHVGVYLGSGKFIHSHRSAGVVITRVDHIYWKRRIEGYYAPGWLT